MSSSSKQLKPSDDLVKFKNSKVYEAYMIKNISKNQKNTASSIARDFVTKPEALKNEASKPKLNNDFHLTLDTNNAYRLTFSHN